MQHSLSLILIAIGAIIGTGSYVLFPAAMYLVLGIALAIYCVLVVKKVIHLNVQSSLILLAYLIFLLLNFTRDIGNDVASRLYLNFFLGICAYLVVIRIFLLAPEDGMLKYLPLISLTIIAAGILLELNGIIESRRYGEAMESADEGLLLRPGGFLNPNRTATLSLIWLFCALESKKSSYWLRAASIAACAFTLALTQSRAAMLFLFIYLVFNFFEGGAKNLKYYAAGIFCCILLLLAFGSQSDALVDIYDAIALRFQGDGSSDERYSVVMHALDIFAKSPFIGHGMRSMVGIAGLGTHNEIIEWLVNFGLVGFLVMLLIIVRFYFVGSFAYLCMCILPTFLFSHNFFEATSFQCALACAYAFHHRLARSTVDEPVRRPSGFPLKRRAALAAVPALVNRIGHAARPVGKA